MTEEQTENGTVDTDRNDAEYVKESVIELARDTGDVVSSGAWLAQPVEGSDRVDVYRYDHSVDEGTTTADYESSEDVDRDAPAGFAFCDCGDIIFFGGCSDCGMTEEDLQFHSTDAP